MCWFGCARTDRGWGGCGSRGEGGIHNRAVVERCAAWLLLEDLDPIDVVGGGKNTDHLPCAGRHTAQQILEGDFGAR